MLTDFDSNLLLIYETAIKCKGVQQLMELLLLEETQIKSKRMLSMKCQLPTAMSPWPHECPQGQAYDCHNLKLQGILQASLHTQLLLYTQKGPMLCP